MLIANGALLITGYTNRDQQLVNNSYFTALL